MWDAHNLVKERIYAKELIEKKTILEFEGHSFCAPENYKQILTQTYDSRYMNPPLPEVRVLPTQFQK